jgi:LPXTG-motif cell wall-anchored protein
MAHPSTRRLARHGAAVAAAAAIAVGSAAIPAQAAGQQNLFAVIAPDAQTLLPASAGGSATAFRTITPMVLSEATEITGVTIAVDASKLAGVAELSLPKQCSFTDQAHLHASCSVGSIGLLGIGSVDLGIRAASGAADGATGSLSFKVTSTDAVEDTSGGTDDTTAVTIGDGADLAVRQLGDLTAAAGGSTSFLPQVSNLGDRESDGVVMFLGTQSLSAADSFAIGGNYSNCLYGVTDEGEPDQPGSTGVLCRFDSTVVKPGEVMVPADPALVTASATATTGAVAYGFDVTGGQLDKQTTGGTRGTGPALTLVPAPAGGPSANSVDIDYDNNVAMSAIRTNRVDDVAAIGADVHGTVGRSLPLTVGLKNTGTVPTTTMQGAPSANDTAVLAVVFPQGVTITRAPADCQYVDLSGDGGTPPTSLTGTSAPSAAVRRLVAAGIARDGGLGQPSLGDVYGCVVTKVLQPGQTADFGFTAKPTKVLDRAEGVVIAAGQPDSDPADAMAYVYVSAVKAGATTSPTAPSSAPASAVPSPSPSGSLATTGGGDDSMPLVGVGAAAVLLGAGGVLFARRRGGRAGGHS